MTPSPAVLRTTAQNRIGNQPARTAVANPGRRRSARLPTRFTHCAVTPRTRRRPAGPPDEPPLLGRCDGGGLRRSDYSRRDTRPSAKRCGSAPIGGGRESPLTHPAPHCRHDSSRTRGSSPPPPAAAAPARTRRFAAASNRSDRPAHRRCIDRHRRTWEKLHPSRKRSRVLRPASTDLSVRPGPVRELRSIGSLFVRVAHVVDDRVLHLLFQMRGLDA
jgi:hypothetical protein